MIAAIELDMVYNLLYGNVWSNRLTELMISLIFVLCADNRRNRCLRRFLQRIKSIK